MNPPLRSIQSCTCPCSDSVQNCVRKGSKSNVLYCDYLHNQPRGTSVWYWTSRYAAARTSPRWPDPEESPSTTSAGSGLPHEGSSSAPVPSARRLPPRLLQFAPGVTPCLRNQTFAAYPERCSKPRVQPGNILRCDPPFP